MSSLVSFNTGIAHSTTAAVPCSADSDLRCTKELVLMFQGKISNTRCNAGNGAVTAQYVAIATLPLEV